MTKHWRSNLLRNGMGVVAATALIGILLISPPEGTGLAQGHLPPGMEMAGQEEPFRSVAEAFVAAAAVGDATKATAMISPAAAAKSGPEGVERYLADVVLPFFEPLKEIAGSVTVTRTADVTGFAFYMYLVAKTGELRPFVIYVIEEGGAKVVANVLVDHFVADRHCARVSGGWKCPDFSG